MTFVKSAVISQIKDKLCDDPAILGKLYRAKKNPYDTKRVEHGIVDDFIADGWEVERELKTKTWIRKEKSHNRRFEDEVWCQLYELGYRCLNFDDQFKLPYGRDRNDQKQIDVVAVDQGTVILVECKSSAKPKKAPSLQTEFEGLEEQIRGFDKAARAIFGGNVRTRYIFATRGLRIDVDGVDITRLRSANGFYYNDNTYAYIQSLIKNYKTAAHYQFMGILFKGECISKDKLSIPAVEGTMGTKKYYMFSLEPQTLLKIGFILHRTRANESEMPTYQRLLVPSRLKSINKFVNEGGYFPNSVIVNFAKQKNGVTFEALPRVGNTKSRSGMLKIPNAYAIAYIIDGQHRIYGYADTNYLASNTIPVVAFTGLTSTEQLEIFMSINENQKAVSPSLRGTLERDLFWSSDRVDSRLKALRSSIIIELAESPNGPLHSLIQVGEDSAALKFTPFSKGLLHSGLLPRAKGNQYEANSIEACLYDTNNNNHDTAMKRCQKKIVSLLNESFGYVEEKYPELLVPPNSMIGSNRGAYAFITLIGSLNHWETVVKKRVTRRSSTNERLGVLTQYFDVLLEGLQNIAQHDRELLMSSYGTGSESDWARTFQSIINRKIPSYDPPELIVWRERNDKDLQDEARTVVVEIETHIKRSILKTLRNLFGDDWELEIGSIKRKCMENAEAEREKLYKEGLGNNEISWTEMFTIMDYKTIIDKFWAKTPSNESDSFSTFEAQFSINIGEGVGSKKVSLKWISKFNSLRNNLAHEGTKEKGLSKDEVDFLKHIHGHLITE